MINKNSFKALLKHLDFEEKNVDFRNEKIEYPELQRFIINERQTCNFSQAENAVASESVYRLFEKGYKPKHFENVADILDFSRKEFTKTFSLTPKKSITIDTKWELIMQK